MHPHGGAGRGPGAFGEPDVIAVGVSEEDRFEVHEVAPQHGHLPDQLVPVAGCPRVHQGELAAVLDEVEVRHALRQPVDVRCDLHAMTLGFGALVIAPA